MTLPEGKRQLQNCRIHEHGLQTERREKAPSAYSTRETQSLVGVRDPGRSGVAQRIIRRHGAPEDEPEFWRNVSPRSYFDRITEPILIHHGTSDDSCPIRWTHRTTEALEQAGADVRLRVYQGEEHAFGPQWPLAMERTTRFLRRQLS